MNEEKISMLINELTEIKNNIKGFKIEWKEEITIQEDKSCGNNIRVDGIEKEKQQDVGWQHFNSTSWGWLIIFISSKLSK